MLYKQNTYKMSVYLAQSSEYQSMSRITGLPANYITPSVFRVWGGSGYCNERQLLYESPPIDHGEWKQYNFQFMPKTDIRSLTISTYYSANINIPYNGHILIDNISEIILVK